MVVVNFCVLNENKHEKESFINYWKDKVDFVSIQTFTPPTPEKNGTIYIQKMKKTKI